MTKRVFLTGGTGFVGANLSRRLLRDGHEVHLLVRPGYADWRIRDIAADVAIHVLNLDVASDIEALLLKLSPNWVFHLAAHGAYSFQSDVPEMVRTNYLCTVNLALACAKAGVEMMINTGSSSEYGVKDHAPSEDEYLEPNSYYSATKSAATLFCRHTARTSGIPMPTLRLYSVYGPYEDPRRFVPTLLTHAIEKRLPPLVGPETARDFIYTEDVCDAYLSVANARLADPGAVYNLGSGHQTTIAQAVASAMDVFAVTDTPKWGTMSQRSWDTNTWCANVDRIKREIGWQAKVGFRQGLTLFGEWFAGNKTLHSYYLQ